MKANSKILSWFDLAKYSESKSLSLAEWADEIDSRVITYMRIFNTEKISRYVDDQLVIGLPPEEINEARKQYEGILDVGLLTNSPSRRNWKSCETQNRERQLAPANQFAGYREQTHSVLSFTAEDFCALSDNDRIRSEQFQREGRFLLNTDPAEPEAKRLRAKFSYPLSDFVDDAECWSQRYAIVDISASNEQLMYEFEVWLNQIKAESTFKGRSKLISDSEIRSWTALQILPYFDLRTYARLKGVRITNSQIACAIFPDEYEVDRVERVRKVVKPKVASIFNQDFVATMQLQVDLKGRRS